MGIVILLPRYAVSETQEYYIKKQLANVVDWIQLVLNKWVFVFDNASIRNYVDRQQ